MSWIDQPGSMRITVILRDIAEADFGGHVA
jgi:hypothetical protein